MVATTNELKNHLNGVPIQYQMFSKIESRSSRMESSLLNESLLSNGSPFTGCHKYFMFFLLWIVLSAIIFILGFPLSLLTLRELHERSHRKTSNDLFMVNSAVINLAYLVISPFCVFNSMLWNYEAFEYITNIMDALALCTRPLLVACLCMDRYFAVVYPLVYRRNKKDAIRKAAAVIVWLNTLGFISYKCSDMDAFPYPLNATPAILSGTVVFFCNSNVVRVLRMADLTRKNIHPQKKRALQIIFNGAITLSVVYVPFVVIYSFVDLRRERCKCTVAVVGYLFSMSGCVIMPVLFLHNVGKLKDLENFLRKHVCV